MDDEILKDRTDGRIDYKHNLVPAKGMLFVKLPVLASPYHDPPER